MISLQERARIQELLDFGYSPSQISRIINRSTTSIYRIHNQKENYSPKLTSSSLKLKNFEGYLRKRLRDGSTNTTKLYHEIKKRGYKGSYALVRKFIKNKTNYYKPSVRYETQPGEQALVDWGSFGKIEVDKRLERLYCFAYIPGYSRMAYIEFVVKQNLFTLESCHIRAFEKIGIPETIVYDNMKTVVIRRDKLPSGQSMPRFNPAFFDFAEHYRFHIVPCPPYWPRAKGKVEALIKYVRNNFMEERKHRKWFASLEVLNRKAQKWLNNEVNVRLHRTTGEKPIDRWLLEKKYLHFPINIPPYASSPFMVRNSTKDALIQYKSSFYSVPAEYARRKLFIKEVNTNGRLHLTIYHDDRIIAEHPVSQERGKWVVDDSHLIRESVVHNKEPKKRVSRKKIKELAVDLGIRPLSYYDQFIPEGKSG